MADRLKNRVRFSASLDKKTIQELKEFSEKSMIPASRIIEVALKEYMLKYQKH